MKCECGIEARISSAKNIMKNGILYRKNTFVCRNKECRNYEKVICEQYIEIPYDTEDDTEGNTL